jgi:hypothetical protein
MVARKEQRISVTMKHEITNNITAKRGKRGRGSIVLSHQVHACRLLKRARNSSKEQRTRGNDALPASPALTPT